MVNCTDEQAGKYGKHYYKRYRRYYKGYYNRYARKYASYYDDNSRSVAAPEATAEKSR